PDGADDVSGLVHHDHAAGAERRLLFTHAVEIHDRGAHVFTPDHRAGGATRDDGQEIVPTAADTAAVLFDQLLEGAAERVLEHGRLVDVARDHEQLGTGVVRAADAGEPRAASAEDFRHHGDRL